MSPDLSLIFPLEPLFRRYPWLAFTDADARLIASAPELLEALESIESLYDHETSVGELASRLYQARCIARFAIAKATGE